MEHPKSHLYNTRRGMGGSTTVFEAGSRIIGSNLPVNIVSVQELMEPSSTFKEGLAVLGNRHKLHFVDSMTGDVVLSATIGCGKLYWVDECDELEDRFPREMSRKMTSTESALNKSRLSTRLSQGLWIRQSPP